MFIEAATERYRQWALNQPPFKQLRGTPRWGPETCLLETLAAYFRKREWPVRQTPTGLFAEIAVIVAGNRGQSMNQARLRHLAEFALDYDTLDSAAPPNVQFAKPPTERIDLRSRT
jgi:hypothetical protein